MAEAAQPFPPFGSYEEFVAWETLQEGRYEYDGVQVYAMSGASPRHNALEARVAAALIGAVPQGCNALGPSQRISAAGESKYVYADGLVVCGDLVLTPDTHAVLNPRVIIEVLSDSSERDRGAKWQGYQRLETLQDYLLVSQHEALIEQYQRTPLGLRQLGWLYTRHEAGGLVTLAEHIQLSVNAIYEGVWRFPSDRDLP